jgi:hypothetical protein
VWLYHDAVPLRLQVAECPCFIPFRTETDVVLVMEDSRLVFLSKSIQPLGRKRFHQLETPYSSLELAAASSSTSISS